jgi:hypothetical protein
MSQPRVMRLIERVAAGALLASAAILAFGDVPTVDQWKAALFFAAFGVLAMVLLYRTSEVTSGSIGFLPFLSIALISPNVAALATVSVSILASELLARRESKKAVFNIAQYVFAEAVAIGVYVALGGRSILESPPPTIAFLSLVAVFLTINKLAVSTVVALSTGGDTRQHWLRSMRVSLVYDLLSFPLILFFAIAYTKLGPQWSAALALPMLGLRQMYKTNVALQKINEELLQLMVAAIEARDPYTSGHSQRVARYARVIARATGVGARATERIVVAALLHDVGKIHEEFAPILRKPGRLTDEEFDIMKTHAAKSSALIGKVSHFADLVPLVHAHHEAWDGRGYPAGLAGAEIPYGARIIALADTIDAMSSSRPYRPALSTDTVRAEIVRESGRQFDPEICSRLLTDDQWREVVREISLAVSEYPAVNQYMGDIVEYTDLRAVAKQA